MLHVCIPVAQSVLGCVDVWWSRFGFGGTGRSRARLLQGPTGEREKKKTVIHLTRKGHIFSQIRGWCYASCAQQCLKVNAEQYVVHPTCYVVTDNMC